MLDIFTAAGRRDLKSDEKRWLVIFTLRVASVMFGSIALVVLIHDVWSLDMVSISLVTLSTLISMITILLDFLLPDSTDPFVSAVADFVATVSLCYPVYHRIVSMVENGKHNFDPKICEGYTRVFPGQHVSVGNFWEFVVEERSREFETQVTWEALGFSRVGACEAYFRTFRVKEYNILAFVLLLSFCQLALLVGSCRRTKFYRRMAGGRYQLV